VEYQEAIFHSGISGSYFSQWNIRKLFFTVEHQEAIFHSGTSGSYFSQWNIRKLFFTVEHQEAIFHSGISGSYFSQWNIRKLFFIDAKYIMTKCKNCSNKNIIISDSKIFVYCQKCNKYDKKKYCESSVDEQIVNIEPEFLIKTSSMLGSSPNRYGFIDIIIVLFIVCVFYKYS
jgi:hypothetical protein